MAYTQESIPDLTGTVAVVTGANGGLGLETAKALAAHGAQVVIAARNQEKAADAAATITEQVPKAELELVRLDLSDLQSVRAAAEQILGQHEHIGILVNNAGQMAMPERATKDGFEMQLGVNHLGHWALTALLMPALLAPGPARSAPARVVSVTSTAHHMGRPLDPANPHLRGSYAPWKAYGQSKLANYHFAIGLQREFERANANAISLLAHPGLSNTELQATAVAEGGSGVIGRASHVLAARTGMTAAQGAMPQIRAATDPAAQGGWFYAPRFINNGAPVRRRFFRPGTDAAIRILWQVSERETGIPLNVQPASA